MRLIKKISASLVVGMIVFSGLVGLSVVNPATVAAGSCPGQSPIFPRWYDGLCQGSKIQSPGGGNGLQTFVVKIAMNIVKIMLTIVGYVSLAFIIWGGFKYMISGDNSSGTSAAKTTILNAIIGLVLSIMSVAIVSAIGNAIG